MSNIIPLGNKRKQRPYDDERVSLPLLKNSKLELTSPVAIEQGEEEEDQGPRLYHCLDYIGENHKLKHTWNLKDGGIVELYKGFLSKECSDQLYEESKYPSPSSSKHMNWQQEVIKIFGKEITAPRRTAFLGEKQGLTYKYSGTCKISVMWSELVAQITDRIKQVCQQQFNVALLNWYQDGSSYIGWHSDDERDMPVGSKIASISVGMSREFRLKHKSHKGRLDKSDTENYLSILLEHGDLLVMGGTLQKFWKHELPKLNPKVPSSPRINFTFRLVKDSA